MINLIPNEEKKIMFRDFYHRLLNVVLVMLAASFFIASLAITPAFLSAYYGGNLINKNLQVQNTEIVSEVDQNTLSEVRSLQDKMSLIEKTQREKYLISNNIINEILIKKLNNIKITDISYKSSSPRGKIVNISGLAPSREALLIFRKSFEENPAFKEVDLPISNFVKGSNIRFYLTLIPS